jgi:hypothetical protein
MARTEAKVTASSATAAASGMILWVLGRYVFKGTVPDVIASWVYVLVPGALAWAAGYLAPHTHRPDLAPVTERNSENTPPVIPADRPPVTGG